jgi:hypothetical protein
MSAWADPLVALEWVTRLAALGVLLDALQRLVCWRAHSDTGVLGWPWLRTRRRLLRWPLVEGFLRHPNYLGVLGLQAAAALYLVLFPQGFVGSAVAVWMVVSGAMLTHLRSFSYGVYGANRMLLVIFVTLALASLAPASALVRTACLWSIALQACCSYATAGWCRLFLPAWRTGTALVEIGRVMGTPARRSLRLSATPRPETLQTGARRSADRPRLALCA